jgi:hypothetical protein
MFEVVNNNFIKDITCIKSVDDLCAEDFRWYDKDGYELCIAERKFYRAMNFPLTECLYHICWQDEWLKTNNNRFLLDHCMLLHRCDFADEAEEQIRSFRNHNPRAQLLLKSRKKWGIDFALDYVDDQGDVWEIVHIEWDSYNLEEVIETKSQIQEAVLSKDWEDISQTVIDKKHEWLNLEGYKQNDYKAKLIFGWNFAERTQKSV